MFQDVLNYKPKEQDYRIWLVVNPATWLIPILAATLVIALAVHATVFSSAKYNFMNMTEAEVVVAPAAEAAPAPAAPAPAPAAPAQ
jgi:hypothetical protein